ncbi:hypothetical protein NFI96_011522 [Prochilodus magdalenae]|nr:hypothetical protein NFI96_011522 [Prochilodus magdalenae]
MAELKDLYQAIGGPDRLIGQHNQSLDTLTSLSVFDHPHDGKSQGELLSRLRQGSRSVAEYSLEFRTIAAGTGWNEPALLTFYRLGLNQDVLTELACRDDDLSLDELITLAIRLDHLKSRSSFVSPRTPFVRTPRSAPRVSMPTPQARAVPRVTSEPSPEEPMQCDSSHLSRAERLRRLHGGLCLYCGARGHFLRDCQVRPQRFRTSYPEQRAEPTLHAKTVSHPTPGMISKSLLIPVTLHCQGSSHVFAALIDSGAEGNFIHARIATQLRVPIVSLDSPLRIAAVDGDPVGKGVVSLTTQLIKMDVSALHSEELSAIASPLTSLLKGNAKRLAWNAQAESAFNELKARFTSAPLLKHPDPSEPFVVEVDASNLGVGAVLSQRHGSPKKLYPIAFFSHKLSPAERNYGIGDRELLAMKLALEEWRHWLEGAQHPFLVLTDHKNLEYLRSAKRLNPRQARWSLFFSRFDFKITFRPGSRNTKADSLSRIYDSEDTALPDPEPILDPKVVLAPPSDVPSVEHWMKRSEEVWEETDQHIEMALQRNKRHADKHRGNTPTYVPGDRVWLSTRDFRFSEGCRKLLPKYIGPFKIISKVNDVTYKLELPPQYRVCSSFHVSLLKPVVPGPLDEVSPETTPPAPIDVGGTPVYAVRRLLDSRRRGGTLQYLVDWEGYGPEERSWVLAADVLDPALVEEFHRCHPSRPAPRPRGRPRRLSLSPSTGRRSGQPRRLSLSPSLHRRRGRPRRRVPIPCRDRSRSTLPSGTGLGGGAQRGRPRSLSISDSLGGGTVTPAGSPPIPNLLDSVSHNPLLDDSIVTCPPSPSSAPSLRSRSPEY